MHSSKHVDTSPTTTQKYHALLKHLPSNTVLSKMGDFFFAELYWILPIIERPFFDELFQPWIELRHARNPTTTGPMTASNEVFQFGALLAQMLAVVMQLMLSREDARETLDIECGAAMVEVLTRKFHQLGLDIMSLLGRSTPTVTSIQHSMLRMQSLKNAGRGMEAWSALGEATRLVMLMLFTVAM
jgi:hypothetical protein